MKGDLGLFVLDILEAIENIEDFTKGLDKNKFLKDKLRQSAVIRQLEIIGESVKNIPFSFRNKYPSIPWKEIAGFRDVLTHGHFGVNLERVWLVLKKDLPFLKKKLKLIADKEDFN